MYGISFNRTFFKNQYSEQGQGISTIFWHCNHSVPGLGNVINHGAPHGFEPQNFEVTRGQFFMPHDSCDMNSNSNGSIC